MTDDQFINEYLRRFYCAHCVKHEPPEKCAKKNAVSKHDGYWCRAYRCDVEMWERVTAC